MQFWVAFSRHTNYISVRANISQAQPGKTKQQLLPYEKRSTRRGLRSASGDLRGLPRNAGLFVVTWGRPSSSTPMRSSFFPHQYRGARPPNGLLTPHSCRRDSSPLRLPCPPTFCLFRIVPLPLPQSLYGGVFTSCHPTFCRWSSRCHLTSSITVNEKSLKSFKTLT
jgi:hypothetical protein